MLRNWIRQTYWPLVGAFFGLLLIGSLFIYSAALHDSGNYLSRHVVWGMAAMVFLLAMPFIGYRTFLGISYLLYAISIVLLLLVLILGEAHLGAQRWLYFGPIVVQPSEFAKLATVLAAANYLGSRQPFEGQWRTILTLAVMVFTPFILIVKQPDLGSALLFIPIAVISLFLWGMRLRILVTSLLGGIVAAPFAWHVLKDYQKQRIMVFLNPSKDPLGSGYTAIQSKIAVGSGGLFGKGYLQGSQSQLQFVPEHHTDFIFCVIGEEWGFVGALILLGLYGVLFKSAFDIMSQTTDPKAKLLIGGVLAVMFSQVFINIGMTFGLMPITGLTLPLISYGGSSLVATSIALGLVLSIYRERSIF